MKATMKAWRVHRLGEPRDVMRLEDGVPVPLAGADQVLVRVDAVALNFPDVLMCRGLYQVKPPMPFTPGIECSGRVVSAGAGFAAGDRVLGTPSGGGLSEMAALNAGDVFAAPATLDNAQAAAFHIAYQTGWFGLHRRARLSAGETLLVHAGAGGVGSAAIQLGTAAGATVIAVVGGPAKAAVATALGADLVIDRHTDDFVTAVKDATGGRGADVIYDPVGGDTFTRSTKCVAFEGRIVVVGFASGEIAQALTSHALVKNYSIVGLHWGLYKKMAPRSIEDAHTSLCELVASGAVTPLVSARIPFAEAADGITALAAGGTTGRVVVELS